MKVRAAAQPLVLVAALLAGCTSSGHATDVVPSPSARATTPTDASSVGPLDMGRAVSASKPSAGAADALAKCQVGSTISLDRVQGMELISPAREAPRYVALTGREPEIQSDEPAWVIQFRGEIPMPANGEIWTDPVCVVTGDVFGYYATGPVKILPSGVVVTPGPLASPPDRVLPSLAP